MPPVVLISLDGVRPDALTTASCPALHAVREQGSSTLSARSVFPSVTLPCHTSVFHSVPPSRHGITSNIFTPMARPLPGIFEIARASDKRVAFFYNWEQLRDLARPGQIHYAYFRDSSYDPDGDDETVSQATGFIRQERPDFAFVYIGTVDTAGHAYGCLRAISNNWNTLKHCWQTSSLHFPRNIQPSFTATTARMTAATAPILALEEIVQADFPVGRE